jgi:hypothetical protein
MWEQSLRERKNFEIRFLQSLHVAYLMQQKETLL